MRTSDSTTFLVRPDIERLLTAVPAGPEEFTLALLSRMREVAGFVCNFSRDSSREPETLAWMLMELTSNAISSAPGSVLGRLTGLTRDEMLGVFGTSVIWPGDADIRHPTGSEVNLLRVERVLGMKCGEWLDLPALERFTSLELLPGDGWVTVRASVQPEWRSFAVWVSSTHPPLDGDLSLIRRILREPDTSRDEVLDLRKAHTDSDGMYHIPSFSGGGGLGLLECIRLAGENDLELDWRAPGAGGDQMVFILGRNLEQFSEMD